jgi:hypothetical protein
MPHAGAQYMCDLKRILPQADAQFTNAIAETETLDGNAKPSLTRHPACAKNASNSLENPNSGQLSWYFPRRGIPASLIHKNPALRR